MRTLCFLLIFGFFIHINAGCSGNLQNVIKEYQDAIDEMDKSVSDEFDKITEELTDLFSNEGIENIRALEQNGKSNFLSLAKKNYNNSVLLKILNLKALKLDSEGL